MVPKKKKKVWEKLSKLSLEVHKNHTENMSGRRKLGWRKACIGQLRVYVCYMDQRLLAITTILSMCTSFSYTYLALDHIVKRFFRWRLDSKQWKKNFFWETLQNSYEEVRKEDLSNWRPRPIHLLNSKGIYLKPIFFFFVIQKYLRSYCKSWKHCLAFNTSKIKKISISLSFARYLNPLSTP